MKANRLSRWISPALILAGVVLLIVGLISFFSSPSSNSPPPGVAAQNSTATSLPTIAPSPPPTPTPFNPPSPAPLATSPLPTPTSLQSTLTQTLTSSSALASALTFNGDLAYQHVLAQTAIGPRPTGTEAGWATGDFILAELEKAGWPSEAQ